MKHPGVRPSFAASRRRAVGFTMLEVMIACAIVAILAAIALPNYADYITRGKITEATTGLSDMRQRYEQFFLDTRSYAGGCATVGPLVGQPTDFTLHCDGTNGSAESPIAYTVTATGTGSMAGFTYSIDNTGAKTSSGPNAAWSSSGNCWLIRKGGGCE
jgi:type IV pilus assembly protein PilE